MNKCSDEEIKEGIVNILDAFSSKRDDFYLFNIYFQGNKDMMELFFKNFFMNTEGWSCSTDKARFVVRQIFQALKNKEHLPLQEHYDINKHWQAKQFEGKLAYWCPENLKDTKEAMELFWSVLTFKFDGLAKYLKFGG